MSSNLPEVHPNTKWQNQSAVPPAHWICGHCNRYVGDDQGYGTTNGTQLYIRCCPACHMPTVFHPQTKWHAPAAAPGHEVENVPADLSSLYDEARRCAGVGAFTSAAMACRAILMHIAVEKGAKQRETFEFYVQYLADNNYIPPEGKALADYVKSLGRDANHKIKLLDAEDATASIKCVEILLRLIYELPGSLPKKVREAAAAEKTTESAQ